jgi:hypothetical protein
MAVFCCVSASGSPGVTSTVLGMALCWPRPVLVVEADPTAGSAILAGRFRGLQGHAGLDRPGGGPPQRVCWPKRCPGW